ncbi:hypothetical protein BPOR_0156g00020 [Botrytis porri]|uniref:2EXR domain-containing protein n=1 Tax=Botrytis porri TaxID=87229 RepID=A0A4Z1KVI2_9HELO|nr:hypothetical protein BPOR_0156g00020 [Botrytis porri]
MRNLTPWEYIMDSRRFILFPDLSIEIRDDIWRLTLEPRIVEVRPKEDNQVGFYSTAPLPVLLSVCKDSQRAVLSLYPNLIGGALVGAGIRFNAKIDTLYLDWKIQKHLTTFLLSIDVQEAEKIQYLAIDQYIRWARQCIDLEYDWESVLAFMDPLTISDLQNNFFRHCCHIVVDHDICMIGPEDLERLCRAVRLWKKLKELIFVFDDINWNVDLLRESGVNTQQDELAGLTLFRADEVYDLFPNPVGWVRSDYRRSIEYYNDDLPIASLHDELKNFENPKFEILVRYGWRFPDSLSVSSRQPRLTELE